nr:RNA-directed DNA polymerase, eukaryota, reverse transcriptase zinc-binding domain protein [Tanacetum cinerariifolium]
QKAKVRWAIKGDENSKYFHEIINKKRSQLAIRGVITDGEWIDEPCKVADLECDVTFDEIKKADRANILTIVRMLKCFFMASGLQINIHKSKLLGIGVSNEEVLAAANIIGCSTFSTPFSYLGVKVGMFSSRRKAWDEVIGLVSSLSPWNCILRELNSLSSKGINLLALLKKKVGNGVNTLFWDDCWINEAPLFPRLYALEIRIGITVADKLIDATFVASFRRSPRGEVEE